MEQKGGCLYAFGRGSFVALLVFVIPGALVLRYYDDIEAWRGGISEMPVFHDMQRDFKTGVDLVGSNFVRAARDFYADSSRHVLSETLPVGKKNAYWHRAAVEGRLRQKLSSRNHANVAAYLDYVERYRDLAVAEMQRTKIPASITLAQGILETNAGRSILASKANNHFGIKCRARPGFRRDGVIDDRDFNFHSLAVDCMQMTDDYAWDRFEVYESARDSYRRHSLLLQDRRYGWMLRSYEVGGVYRIARKIYGQDEVPYYAAWSVGLKSSGYATARAYAEKLTLIIETYELWKVDYEAVLG
jgi:hypothetical protein